MSKPIGMTGLRRLSNDAKAKEATFTADTSATKLVGLDPSKSYGIFASGAGPADLSVELTSDSHEAVSNGTAKYVAASEYTNIPAAGGFLGNAVGATAARVTHAKNGVAADDANIVTALGGRYQVRFVEDVDADSTGMGDYTPVTADT